jgi:hypothetical protein
MLYEHWAVCIVCMKTSNCLFFIWCSNWKGGGIYCNFQIVEFTGVQKGRYTVLYILVGNFKERKFPLLESVISENANGYVKKLLKGHCHEECLPNENVTASFGWFCLVLPTLRYFTIETLRFYAFVKQKNLTNVYFSL